jgi:hypothetical protein
MGNMLFSKGTPVLEKRSTQRRRIATSILCSHFRSMHGDESIEGEIKNCCATGFCAELKVHVEAGTILVIRRTGSLRVHFADRGVCPLALAEVRWAQPKSIDSGVCYATGMKYLTGVHP